MQFKQTDLHLKILAMLRFIAIRIILNRKFIIQRVSYIGKHNKFFVHPSGSIYVAGKINIRDYIEIQAKGEVRFGNGCGINSFSRIIAFEKIHLGNNVSIAQFVSILDHDHDLSLVNNQLNLKEFTTSPIIIGNNVWLGDKVTITKGVKIGNNVVIGANSVVTKDIPDNSLAAGIPARVLKTIL